MNRVFIALGSNIDSEHNMREAVRRLSLYCRLLAVSPVYETAPVGNMEQPANPAARPMAHTAAAARTTLRIMAWRFRRPPEPPGRPVVWDRRPAS